MSQYNKVERFCVVEADKSAIDEAVKKLLELKSAFKNLTGVDLAGGGSKKDKKAAKKASSATQVCVNCLLSVYFFLSDIAIYEWLLLGAQATC